MYIRYLQKYHFHHSPGSLPPSSNIFQKSAHKVILSKDVSQGGGREGRGNVKGGWMRGGKR